MSIHKRRSPRWVSSDHIQYTIDLFCPRSISDWTQVRHCPLKLQEEAQSWHKLCKLQQSAVYNASAKPRHRSTLDSNSKLQISKIKMKIGSEATLTLYCRRQNCKNMMLSIRESNPGLPRLTRFYSWQAEIMTTRPMKIGQLCWYWYELNVGSMIYISRWYKWLSLWCPRINWICMLLK